jgi:SAM-dependent MidA family methyltransferase
MPPLARLIREEIAEKGPIPFARFMELALYCPEYGFYEKEGDNPGRGGDFYTSVSVGSVFGELLAFQFSMWFEAVGIPDPRPRALQLIESGAHDGRLALDILDWLRRQRPEVLAATEYLIMEPSPRRRERQRSTLAEFAGQVRWLADWDEYTAPNARHAPSCTIIFSNELLDAMPVHRFGWNARKRDWFEWGVNADREQFTWTPLDMLDPSSRLHLPSSPRLLDALPDGYTIEASPAAESWWRHAAGSLRRGKLLTFDYGFDAADKLRPERTTGTLRAYRNHKFAVDVLADPGEQDITAHVDFPRIETVGIKAGLKTEAFESQGRFLTQIAIEAWKPENRFGDWDPKRTRQFQTLTHPQHLGQSFRVLLQSRG